MFSRMISRTNAPSTVISCASTAPGAGTGCSYCLLYTSVVYRALYGERGLWVRPAAMWGEQIERDGQVVRRFTYIGD